MVRRLVKPPPDGILCRYYGMPGVDHWQFVKPGAVKTIYAIELYAVDRDEIEGGRGPTLSYGGPTMIERPDWAAFIATPKEKDEDFTIPMVRILPPANMQPYRFLKPFALNVA